MTPETVRIFVSSPDDVKDERSIVKDIIERLRIEYEAYFEVNAILWENEAIVATGGFQEALVDPGTCDIVLVIFWSKLGTPLPQNKFGGLTGTEWEFINAIEHSHEYEGIPQVLVYRKDSPMLGNFFDDEAVREVREDKNKLDSFFKQHFFNPDGSFKRAYRTFQDQNEFANLVETQLHKLLDERKGSEGLKVVWKDSPFRGLQPFEFEHHAIFFGRDQAKRYLLRKLAKQIERGIAFVMIQAMSGSGKSSLVKAGLLPQLTAPRVIGDVVGIRWCTLRPSDGEDNPLRAIAQAIMRPDALGTELPQYGVDEDFIMKALSSDPALLKPSLQVALEKIAEERYQVESDVVRLVIVVDQFEELFSQRKIPLELKQLFVRNLDVLARSGMVWVIGTMRSDFLHETEAYPELQALMENDGQFHLFPPRHEEIEQMIREPAKLAGLEFESRDGVSLDETLLKDATSQQGALPLLEFTLDALYERRVERELTYAAYESIGGLAGAVADRAEKVFTRLPDNIQSSLSPVFRALVTINPKANEKVTARRADWTQLAKAPENKAFIDAFIDAHLLVSDQASAQEKQVVWVAHEALLRNWPRVAKWVESNIEDLRVRSRIAEATALWDKEGRNDQYLLPEGKPFAEATDLLNRVGQELEEHECQFIDLSTQRIRASRSRERVKVGIGIALFVLSLLAIGGLYFTFNFSLLAMRSIDNNRLVKADEAVDRGNTPHAISLAEAADILPRQSSYVLSRAISNNHLVAMIKVENSQAVAHRFAGFNSSLHHALTYSPINQEQAKPLTLWRIASGKPMGYQFNRGMTQWPQKPDFHNAAFSADGQTVFAVAESGVWQLPADGSGGASSPAYACKATSDTIIKLSNDGHWAAISYDRLNDGSWLCLMDLQQPGRIAFNAKLHDKHIRSLMFSPDSRFLSTASEDFNSCLMALDSGTLTSLAPTCIMIPYTRIVNRAKFNRASTQLAIASVDGISRIFDINPPCLQQLRSEFVTNISATPTTDLGEPPENCGFKLENDLEGKKVHLGAVRDVAFSYDGKAAVTVGDDAKVVYWDISNSPPVSGVIGQHDQGIDKVSFSPDDSTVLTGSRDRTARLWDLDPATPGQLAVFQHDGAVFIAQFSENGQYIGTVSTDGTARVWDTTTVKRLSSLMTQHTDHVWYVDFNPRQPNPDHNTQFVTTSFDKTAIVWNYAFDPHDPAKYWNLNNSVTLRGHSGPVRSAHFGNAGSLLATASNDGTAMLWRPDGTRLCSMPMDPGGPIIAVNKALFGADDRWLLTQSMDNNARIWNTSGCIGQTSSCDCTLQNKLEHQSLLQASAVSVVAEQSLVATADESTVSVWNTQSWARGCTFPATGTVTDLYFSPDQHLLATAYKDGHAELWRSSDCTNAAELRGGHSELIYSIRFNPAGDKVITASQDQSAVLWNLDGQILNKLIGHADRIYSAEFNIDGSWVLTASRDGTSALWKIPQGYSAKNIGDSLKPWVLLEGNHGGVSLARFSPNGQFVASAYWNNAAEIWYVLTHAENGIESVIPAFGEKMISENHLQNWDARQTVKPELKWQDEVMIAIKRLWE